MTTNFGAFLPYKLYWASNFRPKKQLASLLALVRATSSLGQKRISRSGLKTLNTYRLINSRNRTTKEHKGTTKSMRKLLVVWLIWLQWTMWSCWHREEGSSAFQGLQGRLRCNCINSRQDATWEWQDRKPLHLPVSKASDPFGVWIIARVTVITVQECAVTSVKNIEDWNIDKQWFQDQLIWHVWSIRNLLQNFK